jgi:hypothetical protein
MGGDAQIDKGIKTINGSGFDKAVVFNRPRNLVCQEAVHRHKIVLRALSEMVDSSCKLDPLVSFYRKGHQIT